MAVLLIFVLTVILTLLINWYLNVRYPNAPPGPMGLPILGSLLSIKPETPHYSLTEIAKKYSKNGACQIFLGSIRSVILTDPKLIREAFAKEEFSGRAPLFLTHGIMHGNGIICAEGELWKDQRKLLTAWIRALGAAKTSTSREKLESRIFKRLERMKKLIDSRSDLTQPVHIHSLLSDSIGNTISELTHGVTFRENDKTWRWLLHIQDEGTKAMGVAAIVNFLPFMRFISPSVRQVMHCLVSGQRQTHKIYGSMIELRRNRIKRKSGESVIDCDEKIRCVYYGLQDKNPAESHYFSPKDLIISEEESVLDFYLDEQMKREKNDPDAPETKRLSDTQLVFLLADLFGAGLDTTLHTILWFLLFMSVHKDEQEKVRKELLSHCGSREPSISDLAYLPYTRAAMSEVQRLRSVVPVGIPHGCVKDTMIGEYLIKKGSMVIPLQYAIHTDIDAWEDPLDFKPSRFIGDDGSFLNPSHFIPFQTGKRMCPGDELARHLLFMYGTYLIQQYDIEVAGAPPSLEGVIGLTMGPAPYDLIFHPINK